MTILVNGMTVGAWDNPACPSQTQPVIDCAVGITAASWSLASGQSLTYQANSLPISQVNQFVRAWANGFGMIRGTSIANVEATPNSYFPSTEASSPITLYVHITAGTNPGLQPDGYIEYNKISQAINSAGADGTTISNIHTKRQLSNNGSIETRFNAQVINVTADDGHKHGMLVGPGNVVFSATMCDGYFGASSTSPLIIFGNFTGAEFGAGVVISNLTIYPCATNPAGTVPGSAIYVHDNGATGSIGPVVLTNLNVTGMNTCMAVENSVSRMYVNGGVCGTLASPIAGAAISANGNNVPYSITGLSIYANGDGIGIGGGVNTITNVTAVAGFSGIDSLGALSGTSVILSGSTITAAHAVDLNSASVTLASNSNTFLSTGAVSYNYVLQNGFTYTGDYNQFNTLHALGVPYWATENPFTNVTPLSAWRTLTGQDSHSTAQ